MLAADLIVVQCRRSANILLSIGECLALVAVCALVQSKVFMCSYFLCVQLGSVSIKSYVPAWNNSVTFFFLCVCVCVGVCARFALGFPFVQFHLYKFVCV